MEQHIAQASDGETSKEAEANASEPLAWKQCSHEKAEPLPQLSEAHTMAETPQRKRQDPLPQRLGRR